uniref:Chlorophyll synthase n=2 Tax=Tetraselmis sp. GSL018 TaxID=582737 RepID=A0A061S367_9CHLO
MYGEQGAKWTTVLMTDIPQLLAAAYLLGFREQPAHAALVTACVLVQMVIQRRLLFHGDILDNDVAYMAQSNPFMCLAIYVVTVAVSGPR